MSATNPLATDPRFNELLAAAFDHAVTHARHSPLVAFSRAAAAWAIQRAMRDVVFLAPSLVRLDVTIQTDAPLRSVESLTLRFDGGGVVSDLEHPDDWDFDQLDAGLRRLADQLALAYPERASASAESRLEAFAARLQPLLSLLLSTGEDYFTVERPAKEQLRAA